MRTCKVEGCNNKHWAKGLCAKHYQAIYIKQYYKEHKKQLTEYQKQYRQNNKEKTAKYNKQYQKDNKEHILEGHKKYRKDNPEQNKRYHQKHREHHNKQTKQWHKDNFEQEKQYRKDNKEYILKINKQWWKTPAGKASIKASFHKRRALTKDLTGKTIQQVYEANIAKYGVLTCYLCGKPIVFGNKRLKDSLDHSTPITREGSNNFSNLGIAHMSCNRKKYTMTLKEWFNNNKKEAVLCQSSWI